MFLSIMCQRYINIPYKKETFRYFKHFRKFSHIDHGNDIKQKKVEEVRQNIMSRGLPKRKPIKGVKQIILVASGKGGVGKSTTSVNLSTAIKLIEPNKQVGLLDADVFGPSIPLMMNLHESPVVNEKSLMEPLLNYGVKCMSMGFLIKDNAPIIWRGLMVMSALDKLLRQVAWEPLDYLVIDTPPGTGDTHLSLIQNIPIDGVLLVTTPQKAALDVTGRSIVMFKKLNVPIVGIVENMSYTKCPKCNNKMSIFGDGVDKVAKEFAIPVLQKVPLHQEITKSSDSGIPLVLSANNDESNIYKELAKAVIAFLNKQPINED